MMAGQVNSSSGTTRPRGEMIVPKGGLESMDIDIYASETHVYIPISCASVSPSFLLAIIPSVRLSFHRCLSLCLTIPQFSLVSLCFTTLHCAPVYFDRVKNYGSKNAFEIANEFGYKLARPLHDVLNR